MSDRNKTSKFFGSLAGVVLRIFGKSPAKAGPDDLKRIEFKASTQRLGVRMTKRIRDVFRNKWLRKM